MKIYRRESVKVRFYGLWHSFRLADIHIQHMNDYLLSLIKRNIPILVDRLRGITDCMLMMLSIRVTNC